MSDNKNMNKLINELSKKLGVSSDKIQSAAENGNVNEILKSSDSSNARKMEDILKDPQQTKEILNSPQAQKLLKMLGANPNKG